MLLMRKWQRSLEKSAELHKDMFCLETLELCGYSWISNEEVYSDLCVFVKIELSAVHSCLLVSLAGGLNHS